MDTMGISISECVEASASIYIYEGANVRATLVSLQLHVLNKVASYVTFLVAF